MVRLHCLSTCKRFSKILWNSMTLTSFVFTELANTMKYGEGVSYNIIFTECRHWVSQNEEWERGSYITLFSPSDFTAFHRIWNPYRWAWQKHFVSLKLGDQSGVRARDLWLSKQAALFTTPAPPPYVETVCYIFIYL